MISVNPKIFRVTNLVILFLFLLSFIEYAALTLCRPDSYGLNGVYYDNAEWKGEPYATSRDSDISTATLKVIRKKFQENIFSVEWKGFIDIPESAIYTFSANSDDGSSLSIDDNLVVDNGGSHGLQQVEGKIHLIEGLHTIKILYFQIGGFAALDVAWGKEPSPKVPLRGGFLLPPTTNTASFRIYQKGKVILPFLLALWGLALLWLGISTYRSLRIFPSSRFSHLISRMVYRLCIQPFSFAAQQIIRPPVYHWILVVIYSSIIFLTLSYARTLSKFMIERYGQNIFSHITVATLSLAGAGIFLYFITRKTQLIARLVSFMAIVAIYAFILSPELRDSVYILLQSLGFSTHVLESLDIYPIYSGEKVHFLEYGLLGLLLCKTLRYHIKDKTMYLLGIVIVYIIGMTDEGIQWALPSRVGEYRDIWMNFMSGGLAILAVLLVIRPRVFKQKFQWSSLRPICYTLAAAVIYTGVFLQVVHGFGSRIFMPDSGTEFVSAFSEYHLLQLDKKQLQRFEGKLVEDSPKNDLWTFNYEFRRHHNLRNKYYKNKQLFESYCEQEILKTYFRSRLRKGPITFFEYEPDEFAVTPDPDARVFYFSPGQELAITKFSQKTMWSVISITTPLLLVFATCFPVSVKTLARFSSWEEGRIERIVFRPVFGVILIVSIIVVLYSTYASREPGRPNLLILTVDSCQPDYWSAYGYDRDTTPFFDTLASEGVLFNNAIVPTLWTIPSLASMLTGVNPNVHGIDARGKLMDKSIPTLFEALEQSGYLIGDTSYTLTEPSINSVFKKSEISPDVALSEGRSEESYLLSWMEAHKDKPFFGWVHFHTAHLPYRATSPYNRLFLDDIDQKVFADQQIRFVMSNLIIRKGEVEFDKERHTAAIHALYAQTLRQQDAKIGKVMQKLDELGLRENTLVVITADHGDELLEHGFIGHASTSWDSTIYDDLINVPLLIYYPKTLPGGKKIENQVRMIDIMPTVLDILDIPLSATLQGKSLLPLIMGKEDFQETVFSESTPCGYSCPKRLENNRLRSVRTNEWKLISVYDHDTGETAYELYNLQEDPGETNNVLEQYPEIAAQFTQEMQRWMEAPQQFVYQHQEQEGKHYLDAEVEITPIVLFPKVGTVLNPKMHNQRVLIKWIGDENAEYIIEYDVGSGGYHMTGELEVVGTEQWYGPYPEDIWQALPLYNPWKFRIIPKNYPQYPSDWITFEMKYE